MHTAISVKIGNLLTCLCRGYTIHTAISVKIGNLLICFCVEVTLYIQPFQLR